MSASPTLPPVLGYRGNSRYKQGWLMGVGDQSTSVWPSRVADRIRSCIKTTLPRQRWSRCHGPSGGIPNGGKHTRGLVDTRLKAPEYSTFAYSTSAGAGSPAITQGPGRQCHSKSRLGWTPSLRLWRLCIRAILCRVLRCMRTGYVRVFRSRDTCFPLGDL